MFRSKEVHFEKQYKMKDISSSKKETLGMREEYRLSGKKNTPEDKRAQMH